MHKSLAKKKKCLYHLVKTQKNKTIVDLLQNNNLTAIMEIIFSGKKNHLIYIIHDSFN
jgi:hypothetical protein